jgi:hypothetical protein
LQAASPRVKAPCEIEDACARLAAERATLGRLDKDYKFMRRIARIFLDQALHPALCGILGSLALQAQSVSTPYPAPTGTYDIGRVSFHWKDTARDELETTTAADKRELMVHVFYPREPGITAQRAEYLPDAVVLHGLWSDIFAARIRAMRSYSYDSAPIAKETRRYPVAVFLPGGGTKALLNHALVEDLASHGWIVVAIDPPYNAQALRFPDGRVLRALPDSESNWPKDMDDVAYAARLVHWSRDVSFVIDKLMTLDTDGGMFAGRIDLQRGVGVFGHSFGGTAAGTARLLDSRIGAAINLDGSGPEGPYAAVKGADVGAQPFLWIVRSGPTASSWHPDRLLQPIAGGALRVVLNRPAFAHGDFTDEGFLDAATTPTARRAKLTAVAEVRAWVRSFFDATILSRASDLQRMVSRPRSATPNTVKGFGALLHR